MDVIHSTGKEWVGKEEFDKIRNNTRGYAEGFVKEKN